ncbi:hypothetical protein CSC03_2605 [Enterobacter hormaechei]|nr:hypothetical protein CSC03_2605 [Enterobacter hormaechei]
MTDHAIYFHGISNDFHYQSKQINKFLNFNTLTIYNGYLNNVMKFFL